MKNFIFINGRGSSGKDTQADRIVEKNSTAVRISTGDIYRGAKTPDGAYGRFYGVISPYIERVDSGGLIPDEVMLPIVDEVISEQSRQGKDTFVFTGFPRTEAQLDAVDAYLKSLKQNGEEVNISYIAYSVLETHSRIRAEKRRSSGGALREDDKPDVVERRLRVYMENTAPMLHRLAKEGRLAVIKSSGSIEEVQRRTERALESFAGHPERR